jgi:arylsulfatase
VTSGSWRLAARALAASSTNAARGGHHAPIMSVFLTGRLTLVASVALLGCGGDDAPHAHGGPEAGDGGPASELPSILLVSIDSLRADALGCGGSARDTSPFLDGLAARGVRFANAVSTTSWTLPAHAALFTGLWDSTHGLVDNGLRLADEHLTLAELLRGRGYATAGFYGGPYLHPAFGLAQGFDEWTSCMSSTETDDGRARLAAGSQSSGAHADVTGPRTREAVARWTDGARAPFFLFVHLWDVHYDYLPPPEYAERFDPGYAGPVDGRDVMGPLLGADSPARDRARLRALYDAEVRFTDDVLRGICGELEARGLLANTVVIVTADHGEEFFEHGGKGHQRTLHDEVVRVPLIVAGPGVVAGRVVAEQVRLIDLFPTIAGLTDPRSREPLAVQGRDLGPFLSGASAEAADALLELLVDSRRERGLRTAQGTKVLYDGATGAAELYDLASDPGELRPARAGALDPALEALRRAAASAERFRELLGARPADAAQVPEDVLRRLQELGYLGDGHGD